MQEQPLVSIIIPTYNRAHLIGETLDSVLAQTYQNWECIVVDDGSTDNTETLLKHYVKKDARFQYHKRPDTHMPGGNGARNYGFALSKGAYINWFDSDDVMLPDKIETKYKYFRENKTLDVVFCECESFFVEKEKEIKLQSFFLNYNNFERDLILRKLFVPTASGLWRKKSIQNIRFDETLVQSQDYDFLISAFQFTLKRHEIKQTLFKFRRENKSISNEYKDGNVNHIKSYLKVKLRIINLYKHDSVIEKGISNHILGGLNSVLLKKNKAAIGVYVNTLNNFVANNKNSLLKQKWQFLKSVVLLISITGLGAYRLRSLFRIK